MKPRNLPGGVCIVVLAVACTFALRAAAQDPPPPARPASSQPSRQAAAVQSASSPAPTAAATACQPSSPGRSQSPYPQRQLSPIQVEPRRTSGETYVSYPSNWAEICRRQERYGALQRMEDPPTREARRKFNATVPEIGFETGVTLADAIDRIRRDSGLNIFVNWPALRQYAVTHEQEVTLPRMTNITWRKVLELVLVQINAGLGGVTQLDYALDSGVLTISTRDDLSTTLSVRVYDIGDLLVPRMVVQPGTGPGLSGGGGSGTVGGGSGTGGISGGSGGGGYRGPGG